MHFAERLGRDNAWDMWGVGLCAAIFLVLNFAAIYLPWKLGLRNLERHEI